MKTSILIPCTPEHFIYLNRVVCAYQSGTKTPYEFIIVLSDCEKVHIAYIELFEEMYIDRIGYSSLNVKLILEKKPMFTGAACKLGEKECTGDIIAIQAADDLPHPRRVEIVEKYFESHDIVALNHSFFGLDHIKYYGMEALEAQFDYDNIKSVQPWELYKHHFEDGHIHDVYGQNCGFHLAAGTICYKKDIVGKFTWSNKKHGQDTITCKRILHHFKKSIAINAPLYYYFK